MNCLSVKIVSDEEKQSFITLTIGPFVARTRDLVYTFYSHVSVFFYSHELATLRSLFSKGKFACLSLKVRCIFILARKNSRRA